MTVVPAALRSPSLPMPLHRRPAPREAGIPDDLADALRDLDEVDAEAAGCGIPVPSASSIRRARRLLMEMHSIYPRAFAVYSVPDGDVTEIVIDATTRNGNSVIVTCAPDGSALCLVCFGTESRRARYDDESRLPDGFLREALLEMRDLEEVAARTVVSR